MTLVEYLLATVPTPTRLDLVHCTTVGQGFGLLNQGELRPAPCPEYESDLLYLFYGRPAYKPAADIGASGILDNAPIALVLDPSLLDAAVRVLPFDSGGFPRYAPLLGPSLTRSDFELAGDPSTPMRLVSAFYQTNRFYFDQMPAVPERDIRASARSARGYARLIADPAIRDVDDRSSTIEVQFSTAIPFADALRAIVAPSLMLDDPEVLAALAHCPDAVPVPYKTYGRFLPISFANSLYERVDTFLESRGGFA